MIKSSLPPGFRFHPTDVELVLYYLKKKIMGKRIQRGVIAEVDLYKFAPWDLPDKSCLQSRDLEWYFFCPRDKKYGNGSRTNRATNNGYWKTTGKDRFVSHNFQTVGVKRTLVFHVGRAPDGNRTNWVMHEYRLDSKQLPSSGFSQDAYVLCKLFEKSGPGPKNGEQYGAPFREEEWEDDAEGFSSAVVPSSSPAPSNAQSLFEDQTNGPVIFGDLADHSQNSPERKLLQLSSDDNEVHELQERKLEMLFLPPPLEDPAEIFSGLGDLTYHDELYHVDSNYFPQQSENETELQETLLGFDYEPFLELRDLLIPIKNNGGSGLHASNNFVASASTSGNSNNPVVSMFPTSDGGTTMSMKNFSLWMTPKSSINTQQQGNEHTN